MGGWNFRQSLKIATCTLFCLFLFSIWIVLEYFQTLTTSIVLLKSNAVIHIDLSCGLFHHTLIPRDIETRVNFKLKLNSWTAKRFSNHLLRIHTNKNKFWSSLFSPFVHFCKLFHYVYFFEWCKVTKKAQKLRASECCYFFCYII